MHVKSRQTQGVLIIELGGKVLETDSSDGLCQLVFLVANGPQGSFVRVKIAVLARALNSPARLSAHAANFGSDSCTSNASRSR